MAIKAQIVGADGKPVQVLNGGALEVITDAFPAFGQQQKGIIYRDYFRNTVTSGPNGSQDMRVDGSSTSVEFTIEGSKNTRLPADRYITSISFVIGDGGANLNEFGNRPPLINGVDVEYSSNLSSSGFVSLSIDGLKTNWDLIRLCDGNPAFGTGANAFRTQNIDGVVEAYIPFLDLTKFIPNGIRLRHNSDDRFVIRINDDIDNIDLFTAIASGYDRVKVEK